MASTDAVLDFVTKAWAPTSVLVAEARPARRRRQTSGDREPVDLTSATAFSARLSDERLEVFDALPGLQHESRPARSA
jgi:hypothetical protein